MPPPDGYERLFVEFQVAPPNRLELGDPQPGLGQEADEQPVLRRRQRREELRELLDRQMSPLQRVAIRRSGSRLCECSRMRP